MWPKPAPQLVSQSDKVRSTESAGVSREDICSASVFLKVLQIEQLRAERSGRRFVLMLIESENLLGSGASIETVEQVLYTLQSATRLTDVTGWYKDGATIGTIFTEIGAADGKAITKALLTKVTSALAESLSIEQINQIHITFHVFPEDWEGDENDGSWSSRPVFRTPSALNGGPKKASRIVKRVMDVLGSFAALLLLSPVMIAIAIAIKLTSKGPVLFRQVRVGKHGRRFIFLKFRSMHCRNDASIHKAFVKQLITNKNGATDDPSAPQRVFKIQNDPRVTPVGRFLRRTSLDELPQFINVLIGEMSLVGPRPPIPYEVKCYEMWHRRRLATVRPGITGLWQVSGRSRIGFDDMVRLDLRYARTWSLRLDIKILLQTPHAVVSGAGAY